MPDNQNKLVSIVIPCYNSYDFIDETIESTLHQTYQDIEIIIADDGSTDNRTIEYLEKIEDDRVKVFLFDHQGIATNRNRGIRKSKGEYILPLDADDKIEKTFLEKTTKILEMNPDVGFVTTWVQYFGESKGIWKTREFSFDDCFSRNTTATASLFRKSAWDEVNGYDESGLVYEDWDFWISLAGKGWKSHVIKETLFFYRVRPDSGISGLNMNRLEITEYMLNKHKDLFREFGVANFIKKEHDLIKCRENGERIQRDLKGLNENYNVIRNEKILLIPDFRDWAYDHIADNIKRYLNDEYEFMTLYARDFEGRMEDLLYEMINSGAKYCFIFWRIQLSHFFDADILIKLFSKYDIDTDGFSKFVNRTAFFSAVYDHLYTNQDSINRYRNLYNTYIDSYFVSSQKLKEVYDGFSDLKKPKMVIHDGVDTEKFTWIEGGIKNNDSLVVGWVGNSKWQTDADGIDHKGFQTIIKPVVDELVKDGYSIELRYADLVDNRIPFNQMPEFYRGLDVYICASDIEGTPNTVLEAMASGLAVISTDVGVVPEVFGDFQSEFIVKERSKGAFKRLILDLYGNPEMRKALSEENILKIREWDWEIQCMKFREFFKVSIEEFKGLNETDRIYRLNRINNDVLGRIVTRYKGEISKTNEYINQEQKKDVGSSTILKLHGLDSKNQALEKEVKDLKESYSFKIGYAATRIPSYLVTSLKNIAVKLKLYPDQLKDRTTWNELENTRLFIIGGTNFSGSTLLSFLLGAHKSSFSTGEIHTLRSGRGKCSIHWNKCSFWTPEILDELNKNPEFYKSCNYLIKTVFDPEVILYSSKLPGLIDQIITQKIRINGIIILFKRPEAYYRSESIHQSEDIQQSLDTYFSINQQLLKLVDQNRFPFRIVFYDDLASDTETVVKDLCEFIQLPYQDEMLTPWLLKDDYHTIGGNSGMYAHIMGKEAFKRMKVSDYWKKVYSDEHTQTIEENFQQISLDDKWKSLGKETLKTISQHKDSREIFERLMSMREHR